LPIIGGSSGSSRGIATVDCARERERDDEGVVALAVVPVDDEDGREEVGREMEGREVEDDTSVNGALATGQAAL
jgi:hypothetical protein